MKNSKIIIAVVAVVLVALVAIGITNDPTAAKQKETVKIGLSLPLTGNVAFLGEPAKKAAELALKEAGKTKYQYELIFEDNQFDPKKAASAESKFINIDKVLATVTFGSGTGNAAKSIAESGKTVQFSLASDPTVAEGEYNYIDWTPAFKEGELLAKELIRGGYKKVAIMDTNHAGTLAVTNAIKKSLEGSGVEIVSYDLTNVGDKDFRTIIKKIDKANPDIIVLEMFSPEIEIAARQLKELGINKPLTSVETFEWSSNPELFEGAWFVSDSVVPEFAAKYKAAYGTDPAAGSSYVYDLVLYLISLQEKQDKLIDHADLPAVIKKSGDWNSPIFGKIKIDNDGFFITEASVKMIKGGKVVGVK